MKIYLPAFFFATMLMVCADDNLLKNGDFAKGDATGWSGDFKLEPPDMGEAPTNQINVQLDPDKWTTLTQDIDIKANNLNLTVVFSVPGNTLFSKDAKAYQDESSQLGMKISTPISDHFSMGVIILSGGPPDEQNRPKQFVLQHHANGVPTAQNSPHEMFSFRDADNHRTVTIALPPGRGIVSIHQITAESSTPSDDQTSSQPGTNAMQKEVAVLPLLQNGDFSDGTNHWRGEIKTADSETSTDQITGAHGGNGITVELHPSTWTKFTQDIDDVKLIRATPLEIEFVVSNDFSLSSNPKDYGSVGSALDFGSAVITASPGQILAFVDCAPFRRATSQGNGMITVYNDNVSVDSFAPSNAVGQLQRARLSLTITGNMQDKPVFCIAIPPGKGSITFTKVSMGGEYRASKK